MRQVTLWIVILFSGWFSGSTSGQISPGDLAEVHMHLEGISNCTKCHTIGSKVTNEKCLDCHTEIKGRINQQLGYHASIRVRGKTCVSCHSDHHGRNFDIVHFQKDGFDHALTGYTLTGAHTKPTCTDCHKPANISDQKIRTKQFTYLGLTNRCLGCHEDYHQQTLSPTCSDCHGVDSFKPAVNFSHDKTRFPLTGRHQTVSCADCHKTVIRNGTAFQEFAGTNHQNCTSCHPDVHQNKFGQKCTDCHSTVSFRAITGMSGFDHSRTGFPLENKHAGLVCSSCHKGNLTDPVKHEKCTDCHTDYHEGDFMRQGAVRSCADCHTTKGFQGSSFTLGEHNQGPFILKGSHQATPCFVCHQKEDRWRFRGIGTVCSDCHQDIHFPHLSETYY
ncbi:MAG: cytochrome C, partial [Bacteroidales bacterium]|nr:cytochrome C [Bacteroidales bacterium]